MRRCGLNSRCRATGHSFWARRRLGCRGFGLRVTSRGVGVSDAADARSQAAPAARSCRGSWGFSRQSPGRSRQRWGRLPSEWKPAPTTMGRPPPGGRAGVAIRSGSGGGRAGPVIQQSLCASRPSYQPVTHRRRRLRHLTHAAGRWAVTSRVRGETLRAFFDLGMRSVSAAAGGTRGPAAGRLSISNFGPSPTRFAARRPMAAGDARHPPGAGTPQSEAAAGKPDADAASKAATRKPGFPSRDAQAAMPKPRCPSREPKPLAATASGEPRSAAVS
jgi:hypothetical protein